jgi:hypothetical protein
LVVEQQAVALHALFQTGEIGRRQLLHRARRIGAMQKRLAHMRDIKQARFFAGVQMFFDDARGVLHRHFVAGEGHDLAAQLDMQRIKRRAAQILVAVVHGPTNPSSWRARDCEPAPPLSSDLRELPLLRQRLRPGLPLR